MKRTLYAAVGVFLLFVSCRKDIGPIHSENPLTSKDYQVVEYHRASFDGPDEPPFIFPFRKKYDASGRTVIEIDGSYDYPLGPYEYKTFGYREMKVSQKGRMVYLTDKNLLKNGAPDTLLKVTLNAKGRPETSIADSTWIPTLRPSILTETYIYKDDRLIAVKEAYSEPFYGSSTESLVYDQYGDLLSFNGNSYEYDHTHPARQQFYCEGWQPSHEGFQYLEYLGYFPEVTSPSYFMTKWIDPAGEDWTIGNQKFDSRGRLISYDYATGPTNNPPFVTITWK